MRVFRRFRATLVFQIRASAVSYFDEGREGGREEGRKEGRSSEWPSQASGPKRRGRGGGGRTKIPFGDKMVGTLRVRRRGPVD